MLKKSVRANLETLSADLRAYRKAMDRVFSKPPSKPRDCRKYFFELLVSVSRLYLDYLLLVTELSKVHARKGTTSNLIRTDVAREGLLRRRFKKRLKSLRCWTHFRPENSFSEVTALRTLTDYMDSFALHLPEIYEETLQAEQYAQRILTDSGDSGAYLTVSLEHLGRNHISFVLQALQWVSDEISWP